MGKKPKNRAGFVKMLTGNVGAVKIDVDGFIKKQKNGPDMNDSNNWKATCEECRGTMDYFNFRYCCRKCGHILEV